MGKTLKARLDALEKSAAPDWRVEVLAKKRAWWDSPEGEAWREAFSRDYAGMLAFAFRPEFHTPAAEVCRNVEAHVRGVVEWSKCRGREYGPGAVAAMVEESTAWACGLTAEQWCEHMTGAGYDTVYPDRIARARGSAGVAP